MQTNPAKGPYLRAGVRPTKRSLLLGLRGRGGSHGLGLRISPTRPEPPEPSVALSRVARTQAQAPSGREEAVVAGRGGAGRGYLRRAPPGRGTWERLSRRTKAAGDGSPHSFLLGPAPELELDTLSGRWRGSLSEPGQDSPATFGPGGPESIRPGP